VQRVRHRPAERPRVQVPLRSAQVNLGLGQAPHAGAHRRHVRRPHRGVGDDDHVASEPVGIALQQGGEVRRPRLLLAFDQELEGDRRRGAGVGVQPARGGAGPRGQGVEEHLALVVGGPAPQQLAAALRGLERRRLPLVERLDRLHVVVPVDEHGGRRRVRGRPVREHRGKPGAVRSGFPDLRHREAALAQVPRQPFRAAADIGAVRRVGRDRRYGQPLPERVEEAGRVLVDVTANVHGPPSWLRPRPGRNRARQPGMPEILPGLYRGMSVKTVAPVIAPAGPAVPVCAPAAAGCRPRGVACIG